MIKIGIVDDHAIVRSGLKQFLSEHVDLRVEGEAANGREAIDLVRNKEIDVLLMDLSMPGQSGLDALAMLRAKAPDMGILILSGYPEEHYAINLIRQGASGYLNKECEPKEIAEAIQKVDTEMFHKEYAEVFAGDEKWQAIQVPQSDTYEWQADSTYIQHPPFFDDIDGPLPVIEFDRREGGILGGGIFQHHDK